MPSIGTESNVTATPAAATAMLLRIFAPPLAPPVPTIREHVPAASCAGLAQGHGVPVFSGVDAALGQIDTQLRLFGKPRVEGHRRVAVTLALGGDIDEARAKAREAAAQLRIELR